ncbi:DUF4331 domain-containing protein [Massilia psychrophila]|uniref:DUF4331 domain-containing protein n=1 Tax=Massilia psychrophila TaxID=1603353 RepID=A0A2G8T2D7_9BURK|nr:DUF4331 domain-containing protein [Massilia psychrophila]PIL40206.1 hypothetical protein CR103_08425 [Massilia psychrophila]GGE75865.1 hypothetical protein GCM10008020_20630 [Massilia psychrophila]
MNNLKRNCLAAMISGLVLGGVFAPAQASSHREAPFLTNAPKVDGTDFFMFRSYAPDRGGYVTMIADFIPFQDPQGGPHFYQFDQNALYEIHVDNDGDAKEDVSFQFRFKNTSKKTALTIGGKSVLIPLINSSTISGVNPASLNVRETFTIDMVKGDRRGGTRTRLAATGGATEFDKPVDNIGDKVFGGASGYETYANKHLYDIALGACGTGRVFVGQRKEPFYIAVGKIFDLFNLNPLGAEEGGNKNNLEGKNISSIAIEVPIACVTNGKEPVIGGYATASMRQGRLLNPFPGTSINNAVKEGGGWSQVSRVGMPLVNEVIIGLDDKDKFNTSKPRNDGQFIDYVTNPALPAVVETLFPAAKAPTNFPRNDLVTVFLKGLPGVNQPANVVASEMLRLNTSIEPTAAGAQNALGVAGGDNAGFPNGRRPADDVVDVSLRVAMGALCALTGNTDTLKVGCKPSDAPAGALPLTDGVRKSAADFQGVFPYLNTPLPGNN